ncbi:MAG TPA: hypothetical protein VMF51_03260 [Nocardioides sp.]|uniref:hypothetical protein n=1 Tax=Nocardioides sp. TaxID=35761 RepID=UPI002BD64797|nr:hypothetical protein [Nocardioides sp.]HTW14119.1 hypothetical protein [Nocardioides sp.]
MTSFGPQLIGETEKALNALLRLLLNDAELTEPEWVTLRLAGQAPPGVALAEHVRGRAHFPDARALVDELEGRGLVSEDRLSPAGGALVAEVQRRIAAVTAPIWRSLDPSDVVVTERVLRTVAASAREVVTTVVSRASPGEPRPSAGLPG